MDTDARIVEVWYPDDTRPEIVTGTLRWRVTSNAPELVIDLEELFAKLPQA